MAFSHIIDELCYHFADLKDLLAKATPLRSEDVLAGVAAGPPQLVTKESQ